MGARNAKRFTVIVLGLLTIVIGVIAVIVATQLQQSQAPTDSSASDECDPSALGTFTCDASSNPAGTKITCKFIGGAYKRVPDGLCCGSNQLFCGGNPSAPTAGACGCQPNDGVTTCSYRNQNNCQAKPTTPNPDPGTGGSFACPNGGTAKWCARYKCPNGDTNGDGKCETGDTGVTVEYKTNQADCDNRNFGGACYQIDFYNGGVVGSRQPDNTYYCGHHIDLDICKRTTTTAPGRGVCTAIDRTPAIDEVGQPYPSGTSFNLIATFENCTQTNENMRMFVFKGSRGTGATADITAANLVATLTPTSATGPGSNNRCRYNFTWNGQAGDAARYKFRVGRLGANGGLDLDRLETNNGCTNGVDISVAGQSVCGQTCGSNGNSCPNNHTCSNNVCVLNSCLSNPGSCQADKCTPITVPPTIPNTGLFDEDGRPLLIGLILILGGLTYNRLNSRVNLFGTNDQLFTSAEIVAAEPKKRSRDNTGFEKKLLKNKNN